MYNLLYGLISFGSVGILFFDFNLYNYFWLIGALGLVRFVEKFTEYSAQRDEEKRRNDTYIFEDKGYFEKPYEYEETKTAISYIPEKPKKKELTLDEMRKKKGDRYEYQISEAFRQLEKYGYKVKVYPKGYYEGFEDEGIDIIASVEKGGKKSIFSIQCKNWDGFDEEITEEYLKRFLSKSIGISKGYVTALFVVNSAETLSRIKNKIDNIIYLIIPSEKNLRMNFEQSRAEAMRHFEKQYIGNEFVREATQALLVR